MRCRGAGVYEDVTCCQSAGGDKFCGPRSRAIRLTLRARQSFAVWGPIWVSRPTRCRPRYRHPLGLRGKHEHRQASTAWRVAQKWHGGAGSSAFYGLWRGLVWHRPDGKWRYTGSTGRTEPNPRLAAGHRHGLHRRGHVLRRGRQRQLLVRPLAGELDGRGDEQSAVRQQLGVWDVRRCHWAQRQDHGAHRRPLPRVQVGRPGPLQGSLRANRRRGTGPRQDLVDAGGVRGERADLVPLQRRQLAVVDGSTGLKQPPAHQAHRDAKERLVD